MYQLFWDSYVFLPPSDRPPPLSFVVIAPLCLTRSPLPLPTQNSVHLYVLYTRPAPSSVIHLCVPRRVRASVAIHRTVSPPYAALGLSPGPWQNPRVLPSGSLCLPCLHILPPFCYTTSRHLLVFGFLNGCPFCARARGQVSSNT